MKLSHLFVSLFVCLIFVIVEGGRVNDFIRQTFLHEQNGERARRLDPSAWKQNEEEEAAKDVNKWNLWGSSKTKQDKILVLKTNYDKVKALRQKLLSMITDEAKQLSSNNQSIVSIAFLAFGVILFDVLTDAIFGDRTNLVASLVGAPSQGTPDLNFAQGRETLLPGLGLFGDNINNLAEVVLNMLTIYLYRDESPDCGQRLLCESNQQAVSRGFLDSLVTYVSGFSVSFFLRQAPISHNLEAMRAGRKGHNCVELYPKCSISL